MTHLKNATVLITGAGGGFGTHLMRQCLAAGSQLIVTDVKPDLLQSAVDAVLQEQPGGQIVQCITADLATREGCESLFKAVEKTPDVLVNNAGLANSGRFDEIPAEKWELVMNVNLLAPMRLVSLFVPGMIQRGSGHIVNISSLAGWVGTQTIAHYSAAKYGLRGFGEALHEELTPFGIKITNVYPFFSRTAILDSPHYGTLVKRTIPNSITSDPAEVIRAAVRGIERNQLHVFPDPTARLTYWLTRFAPWMIAIMNRRMEKLTR